MSSQKAPVIFEVEDLLAAIGPFLTAIAFAAMLVGLLIPINELVWLALNLVYWPFYTIVAVLIDVGVTSFFQHQQPHRWRLFRNGFFPIVFALAVVLFFFIGNWFWFIVFCQCLHLVTSPPDEETYREGCLSSLVLFGLWVLVALVILFGGVEAMSAEFSFPNASGVYVYLPGMLILGSVFYLLLTIFTVSKSTIFRKLANSENQQP